MNIGSISSLYSSQQLTANGSAESTRESPASARLVLPELEIPTRESLDRDVADFAEKVRQKFQEAGIQVPPEPVLGNDFQGYVTVENDHPDKDRIEQLFRENPGLRDQYAKISAQSSLLRAAEHYSRYAGDYERLKGNPAAQRVLVESEIARNKAPFFLTITATGAKPFFGISGLSA